MKIVWLKFGLNCVFLISLMPVIAQAVPIPDNTLKKNSIVIEQGNIIRIDGGTRPNNGKNLFHSFKQFSISSDRIAFFNNAQNIQNVFARVTGNLESKIEGAIRANGTANLFLINPNGIIFGDNAALDIGGSFFATTAEKIQFADGTEFNAVNPYNKPILTVSVPIGLGFGKQPGQIRNRSFALDSSKKVFVGLQVHPGNTIALVGGDVLLEGGILTAAEGRIELGSVAANNSVNISPSKQGFALNYKETQDFQNINLSNLAYVDTSGDRGGDIQIQGRRVTLTGDAAVVSTTFGTETGGDLVVNASETVEMSGDATTLTTVTEGTGDAGNLIINTSKLIIRDGAYVETPTFATGERAGKGGNLIVKASESINLLGTTSDGALASGLFAEVGNDENINVSGNGGNISIETNNLYVQDGATVSTTTFGKGQAGNITIRATESVELVGERVGKFPSGLFARVRKNATGNGGRLSVETGRLIVKDGAQISTDTFGKGQAGDLSIQAFEAVELVGTTKDYQFASGVFSQVDANEGAIGNGGDLTIETQKLTVSDGAQIGSVAQNTGKGGTVTIKSLNAVLLTGTSPLKDEESSSGIFISAEPALKDEAGNFIVTTANAGNLLIETDQLTVEKGAKISADTFGTGAGGDITLNISQLVVQDGGFIGAGSLIEENPLNDSSDRGRGGKITANASEFVEMIGSGSSLFTEAQGTGNAGNLTINTPLLTVRDGAQVTVSATGTGQAGSLTVNADSILLDRAGNLEATTRTGDQGNINLNANDIILRRGSNITTNAAEEATGGDITINTDILAALEDSGITANAIRGRGGNIQIDTQGIFLSPDSQITASSELGIDGTVAITTPEVDPTSGVLELPSSPVDAESLIAKDVCRIEDGKIARGSSFIITGKGGLPPTAEDPLINSHRMVEWETVTEERSNSTVTLRQRPQTDERGEATHPVIQQAQGWKIAPDGTLLLTAQATTATPQSPEGVSPHCQSR